MVFLLGWADLGPLSPGCKHGGQPLRPGHGIRNKSRTIWQLQLVRCFQGKGAGHRQAVGGSQLLVSSITTRFRLEPWPLRLSIGVVDVTETITDFTNFLSVWTLLWFGVWTIVIW
jgi:hypothetical protein